MELRAQHDKCDEQSKGHILEHSDEQQCGVGREQPNEQGEQLVISGQDEQLVASEQDEPCIECGESNSNTLSYVVF